MPDPGVLVARRPPTGLRKLLVPGSCAFLLVLFLIGLGVWQVHRWKGKLVVQAEIAASESRPGVPLADHPGPYTKVVVSGRLRPDLAVLFGDQVHTTPSGIHQGGQLIVPLERAQGPTVLVNLGWIPVSDQRLSGVPIGVAKLPHGHTTIAGYIQQAERPGLLSAPDDVAERRFFTLDPERIGAAIGLAKVAPFTLIAMGAQRPGVYPMPAEHLPHPYNNSFEYALIWFGLALVVVMEFGFWAHRRLHE